MMTSRSKKFYVRFYSIRRLNCKQLQCDSIIFCFLFLFSFSDFLYHFTPFSFTLILLLNSSILISPIS